MGYIKEPEGVDFIINSEPLTEADRKAFSEFIKKDKAKDASLLLRKQHHFSKKKQYV